MGLGRWRTCSGPGCSTRVPTGTGRCERCRSEGRRKADALRPSAAERGYGTAWAKNRAAFLQSFPYCVDCGAEATVPDHDPVSRVELVRRGDPDPDAWHHLKPRCASCHSSKTIRVEGGFGR